MKRILFYIVFLPRLVLSVFLVWADAPLFALAWIALAEITTRATLDDERTAAESEDWDWP